ncbi:hypothetical protein BN971_02926 [Mycobacterium bohemicum DSM 44277]|uniref:Uncharacterized protein n=1 Tax=Mycobacterium bohemicum DSM 44277 TaxID=1236609 RepID=A0A0U0WBV6_MYCBE|nr:hypothetical protein BN971_02926 [Mycobacterium bohemicum DSM 44277]
MNRHQLRTRYRAVFPDVYDSHGATPTLGLRTCAAWLWSGRRGVVAGAAAAALHGARWIPDDVPIELIHPNTRPPPGVWTRRCALNVGETQVLDGRHVTTPERTAFDIGRRGAVRSAVARLDSLARATGFKTDDVRALAGGHPGAPGLRRLEAALDLMDTGAESPRESYLRLLLIDAGLPRPRTQIPVSGVDGVPVAYLDMGWEDLMVGVATPVRQRHPALRNAEADGVARRPGGRGGSSRRGAAPRSRRDSGIDSERTASRVTPGRPRSACRHPGFTLDEGRQAAMTRPRRNPPPTRTCSSAARCWPCPPGRSGGAGWGRRGPGCAATPRPPAAARAR